MWLYIYDYIYIWLYMDISNDVHVVFSMVFPFESPFSGRSSPWAGALEETSWWMPWLSKAADGRMRWVKMPRDLWKWLNYHICTFFNWSYLIMLYHFRWCSPYLWSCFGYARLISFPMLSCFFRIPAPLQQSSIQTGNCDICVENHQHTCRLVHCKVELLEGNPNFMGLLIEFRVFFNTQMTNSPIYPFIHTHIIYIYTQHYAMFTYPPGTEHRENEPFGSFIYLLQWWYVPWHCCCPSEGPDHHGPAHLDGGVALCATHCLTRTARQYDEHWPMSASVVWKPWGFSWGNGIYHEEWWLNRNFIGCIIKNGDFFNGVFHEKLNMVVELGSKWIYHQQ